ncbi:hypothetical protein LAM87_20805, partial [Mycobacterium tuberculosis]|nr:hypothetical protein [Mycobacterium tuberculosis]
RSPAVPLPDPQKPLSLSRMAARSALSGLRSGIRLLAPVSAAPPGKDIGHGGNTLPGLSLIYSLFLLKLPVLTASKSLRRSRKAGAARMDAG